VSGLVGASPNGKLVFVSEALSGERIGLKEAKDDVWDLYLSDYPARYDPRPSLKCVNDVYGSAGRENSAGFGELSGFSVEGPYSIILSIRLHGDALLCKRVCRDFGPVLAGLAVGLEDILAEYFLASLSKRAICHWRDLCPRLLGFCVYGEDYAGCH